jgi:hypothetical protein
LRLPPLGPALNTGSVNRGSDKRMPRTLEEIHKDHSDSPTLRGLVSVLHDKLELRARYALLEYEALMEGRSACSELYRVMSRTESDQIARLSAALVIELQPEHA